MSDPIVIKGHLFLDRYMNCIWLYDDLDDQRNYRLLLDLLGSMDRKNITMTVAEAAEESKPEIRTE
jgi:hypothetical protein